MIDSIALKQLENESNQAYQAFLDYVELGAGRAYSKLVALYIEMQAKGETVPTVRPGTIDNWGSKFEWRKRISAYLAEQRRELLERQRERYLDLMDNSTGQAEQIHVLLDTMIKEFTRLRITKKATVVDPKDASRTIETITLRVNTQDLNNLLKVRADLQKMLRAELGEKTVVEVDTGSADSGKVKLYIGVSPDDWDKEQSKSGQAKSAPETEPGGPVTE